MVGCLVVLVIVVGKLACRKVDRKVPFANANTQMKTWLNRIQQKK